MIAETIPELRNLTSDQKIILAAELFQQAVETPTEPPNPERVRILNERLKYHKAHPDEVSTWEDVRARITANKNRTP